MALKWSNVIVQYSMGVDSLLTSVRLRHVRTEKVRKYLLEYTSALVPCSVDNTSAVLNQTVSLPCLNNAPFNLTHCERRGLLCSGMYKHPSFILMTALSWGDGWTKRKCPYLIERQGSLDGGQEATRRPDLSAIPKGFHGHNAERCPFSQHC